MIGTVDKLYELAKSGDWEPVLTSFERDLALAMRCSRYQKDSSGWTFLHQAAYSGNERAARALITLGASLTCRSKAGEMPSDVAARRKHGALSRLLGTALRSVGSGLWEPSSDPELRPSSCAWDEAVERRALTEIRVAYGGGVVVIPPGSRYFSDSFERVLVGWHGTYDPPAGMDGESML